MSVIKEEMSLDITREKLFWALLTLVFEYRPNSVGKSFPSVGIFKMYDLSSKRKNNPVGINVKLIKVSTFFSRRFCDNAL